MAADTPAQPDPVAAYLTEVRENARTYGVFGEGGHLLVQASERLLGAVEAALAHHQPSHHKSLVCTCGITYPCYEVRDITSALLGTEQANG